MSFDFDDFFKQAGAKAQEALGDLEKVGVPTLQAALEPVSYTHLDVYKRQP